MNPVIGDDDFGLVKEDILYALIEILEFLES